MNSDDPLASVEEIVQRAEAEGQTKVSLPTDMARALLDRATKTGRPRLRRGVRLRHEGWIAVARVRRQNLIAAGVPKGQALDQVAEDVRQTLVHAGSRRLAVSTIKRMIEGPPRR